MKKKAGAGIVALSAIRGRRTCPSYRIEQLRLHAVYANTSNRISSCCQKWIRIGKYIPVATIVALFFGKISECSTFRIAKNMR
ncbi:MAG: hypothetical protein NC127_07755 [Muribaculum sp.]|nr:hypothetical protein [Muribaculum sp.]